MNKKRQPRARKSRARARRPKFLSLRLQFPADGTKHRGAADSTSDGQLDLLTPPQPEYPVVEEREGNDHENVAFFFSAADGGATSLTGLLDASAAAESNSSHADNNTSRLDYLPSLTRAYGEERAALVRNALRSRDRDSSEEKWVRYSEVLVKEEVEVTSSAVDPPPRQAAGVSLKLDYDEIMSAWSDKGPLYIDAADNSQIVPDIGHHFLTQELYNNNGLMWPGCNTAGSWTVPEMAGEIIENGETMSVRIEEEHHELKMGQREASVLRYKEKRQNRLFSKKIRYQVRKLNAEKRPRLKGRFVKRD